MYNVVLMLKIGNGAEGKFDTLVILPFCDFEILVILPLNVKFKMYFRDEKYFRALNRQTKSA